MITPISHSTSAQVAAQPLATTKPAALQQPATQPSALAQAPAVASDTVQVSSVAQQILKESIETSAQTAREAAGGDSQARRLLAKEAADSASVK